MKTLKEKMARQIAKVAGEFQEQLTGRAPQSVTVAIGEDTLVITLHEALSPAEKVLAKSAAGAAQVQEFHRQLFAASAHMLRKQIQWITGLQVLEAAAEVEPASGAVAHAFTSGTVIQIFHLGKQISKVPGETVPPDYMNHDAGSSAVAV